MAADATLKHKEVRQQSRSASVVQIEDIMAEEDPVHVRDRLRIYRFIHAPQTEYGMSLVILANLVFIIMETDLRAKDEDGVPEWIDYASWTVLALFVVEMLLRLYAERHHFFSDVWNLFDFLIIATDVVFSVISLLFSSVFPVSLLRILRLAKLGRISKVLRIFPELRLMLAGLLGALRAMVWGTLLLLLCLLIVSVIAVQFMHPLNKELEAKGIYEGCDRCGNAFASVLTSALTFTQQILAGDSWGMVTIPLIENYPITAFYFLAVFLVIGLAVHNLILGVIVDVAQESRKTMLKEMDRKRNKDRLEAEHSLVQLCESMDTDESGELTKDEMVQGWESSAEFRQALAELDIERSDLDIVWTIMDSDKSGTVNYTEFVNELYNMKSNDSQYLLEYIKYYITVIKDHLLREMKMMESGVEKMEKTLEEDMASRRAEAEEAAKEEKMMEGLAFPFYATEEAPPGPESEGRADSKSTQRSPKRTSQRVVMQERAAAETHLMSFLDESRQLQTELMTRMEAIETKFDASLQESMKGMRSMGLLSVPWQCQSLGFTQRGDSAADRSIVPTSGPMQPLQPPPRGGGPAAPYNAGSTVGTAVLCAQNR